MFSRSLAFVIVCGLLCVAASAAETNHPAGATLTPEEIGAHELRILTPDTLELTLINSTGSDLNRVDGWDFVRTNGTPQLPGPEQFMVLADGAPRSVSEVGFRRRVTYAPLKERDLRIGNSLFLKLSSAIAEGQAVEVRNPDNQLWPATMRYSAKADPMRWSPAIHVNQVGYMAAHPKQALVGFYLGSLGEMELPATETRRLRRAPRESDPGGRFELVEVPSGRKVFEGSLVARPDVGFPFSSYRGVFQADFSSVREPGVYRVVVPGLGASFPFHISYDVAGAFARTYALGLYHQRCGMPNALPFTRFTHGACHFAPAEVPNMTERYENVNHVLAQETEDAGKNPRHTAPALSNVVASLYPFLNKGPINTRGGHHDAGDYSKYTENSATLIHLLVFAADNFPGVGALDNLGIPESGDGRSDILQEAKWEADYLVNMQDTDGGFYFLVYPRERRYENDVTPERGDPQVVFPKTTTVTAAAVAALAQCASSPRFRKEFPEAATQYLAKARAGWAFLESAIARNGKDGAYQKITHYGNDFMHDDELAWAACEMFLATGEPAYHQRLSEWLDPESPDTCKWGWWRLFEAYGHAIRSYAFAARSGRLPREQLSRSFLEACELQVIGAGEDQLRRAQQSAYGTSFPVETKRTRSAGWYFGGDAMFDLVAAMQMDYPSRNDPRPAMLEALLSNLNYEMGCNPVNVTYVTGLGWKRPNEIVHQYAQNDRRVLPPTGIPLGSIQDGFGWIDHYGRLLGQLSFPADDHRTAPYPFYDRWGDSFNLKTEFVVSNQARALAATAWLMANTTLREQEWKAAPAQIRLAPAVPRRGQKAHARLDVPELDLKDAVVVWEAQNQDPAFGHDFIFNPTNTGPHWIEVEAQLPDGRRVFAATNVVVR